MGLFSKMSNEQNGANSNTSFTPEEIQNKWENAYRANPRAYEKEGEEGLLIGFALTEGCDSIFPFAPEEQWSIEGKKIDNWIITMVSTSRPMGGLIGQMEYHEAIKRLRPYIIASSGNWGLIRGMSYDELDGLFDGLPRRLV